MVDLVDKTNHMIEAGRPWITHYGLWVVAAGGLSQGIPIVGLLMPGLALNLAAGFLIGSGELACFLAIKRAFDPQGLLNPGKAVPTLHRCAEFGAMRVHRGQEKFPELPRF